MDNPTCSQMEQVRLIDADALKTRFFEIAEIHENEYISTDVISDEIDNAPTIDPESLRPQGEWVWKHRHHGGFHKYTGVDEFGSTHTITVDERHECNEPYCPNCGKWNESVFLNYCPNCGAKMGGKANAD